MNTPIYDQTAAVYELMRKTAKLEARQDLLKELKEIPKPTTQVKELIKRLENAGTN